MALKSSTKWRFVTKLCKVKLYIPSSLTLVQNAYPLKVVSFVVYICLILTLVARLFHWASYGKDSIYQTAYLREEHGD